MANNIDKPLHSYYDDNVDPDTPDVEIEFDLPEFDEDNVFMMEDGSALITDEEEAELPPIENTPHTANLVAYFDDDELNTL
jgi:hypothetical protein